MKSVWKINLDILELFYKLIKDIEDKFKKTLNAEEREIVFFQLMKEKDIKVAGHTELNKNEFLRELVLKNQTILNIDSEGYKIISKKDTDDV